MAHFAQRDENNVVINVIVVANDDCGGGDYPGSDAIGAAFCNNLLGGTWKQTSYNNNFRKRYAVIGYTYNEELDAFVPPKRYPSWTFDTETANWSPPIPRPVEGVWHWKESTQEWVGWVTMERFNNQ